MTGASPGPPGVDVPEGWLLFKDPANGYAFAYPPGYEEVPGQQANGAYLLSDTGTISVVVKDDLVPGSTIEGQEAFARESIASSGGTIEEEFADSTLGNEPARQVEFTVPKPSPGLVFVQRQSLHGNRGYFVAINAVKQPGEPFDSTQFDEIFDSFVFLDS